MENKNENIELEDFVGQMTNQDVIDLVKHMGLSFGGTPEEIEKYFHIDNHDGVCSVLINSPFVSDYFYFFSYGIFKDLDSFRDSDKNERLFLFLQWMADRFPKHLENFEKYSDMEQKQIMQEAEKKCSAIEQMATDLYWYKEKQKPLPGYYEFTGKQPE